LILEILNFIVGAERAENRVERSEAMRGRCRKRWSGSGSGVRSGNGARCWGYRNRLERRTAFAPLTLRSHAL